MRGCLIVGLTEVAGWSGLTPRSSMFLFASHGHTYSPKLVPRSY